MANLTLKCRAVANYILEEVKKFNEGKKLREQVLMSNKRLQKILYFCEVEYMRRNNGKKLFDDEFYAWPSGPVIEYIYHQFIQYQDGELPPKYVKNEPTLAEDIKIIIDQILEATKDLDTSDLTKVSNIPNGPYSKVFNEKDKEHKQIISKKDMYSYYSKHEIIPQLKQEITPISYLNQSELELFYILPYRKSYNSGGYYRDDDTGCTAYRPSSINNINGSSMFFDNKETLLEWFYKNSDNPIPKVYRVKYISNYKGLDDVFKITNLSNGKTKYITAFDEEYYLVYDEETSKLCEKDVWCCIFCGRYSAMREENIKLEDLYGEFLRRGIKIKYNVYKKKRFKKNIDKTSCFDYVGDPLLYPGKEEAQNKKLILYKSSIPGM